MIEASHDLPDSRAGEGAGDGGLAVGPARLRARQRPALGPHLRQPAAPLCRGLIETLPAADRKVARLANLARLIGPAVAGLLIVQGGVIYIFLLNAMVTPLFVLVLGRIRLAPRNGKAAPAGILARMKAGFVHVWNEASLGMMLLMLLLVCKLALAARYRAAWGGAGGFPGRPARVDKSGDGELQALLAEIQPRFRQYEDTDAQPA